MGKRGRKPKNSKPIDKETECTEEEVPKVVKKRGRRSKKQPTISEIVKTEILTGKDGEDLDLDMEKLQNEIATIKFSEEFTEDISSDEESDDDIENQQYLLELKTLQTTSFKSLIEALKEILVEGNIECTSSGMRIIANNQKKGILVFLQLYAKRFEYYKCNKKKLHMGVSMLNFYKLVKSLNNNSTLTLFIDKTDLNQLGIVIENNERKTTTTYYMRLLDIDVLGFEFGGKSKFSAVVCMSAAMFQKICRDMYNLGDTISIMVHKKTLTLSCNNDENNEIASQETVIAESPEYMRFLVSSNDVIEGKYKLKDIIAFTKCTNISGGGAMKIYFDNVLPMVIEYDVGSFGNMKLCITPESQEEEEA